MERIGDGKNREVLFNRPKPTAGCSANGRRIYIYIYIYIYISHNIVNFYKQL
jgi:hypothetical protein